MKTKVIFFKDTASELGEIFACFPELDFDNLGNKTCYAHIGQHSSYNPEILKMDRFRLAEPEEYYDLKEELESIGYDLKVLVFK